MYKQKTEMYNYLIIINVLLSEKLSLVGLREISNSDALKTTLRHLATLLQNDHPSFESSSKISPHSSVTLSHTTDSISQMAL